MAALRKPFFDTSILLAGLIDFGRSSKVPIEIFNRLAEGAYPEACTAWHCCLEFYSVATRLPDEYRLDPTLAKTLLEQEIWARLTIDTLPAEKRADFLNQLIDYNIQGGRIYDAHIGWVAIHLNASVFVTENKK